MHECCARVSFGEFLHHEVGEYSAMRESSVESEIVAKIKIVHSDLTFGASSKDAIDAAELAGVCSGGKIGHQVDHKAHTRVVIDSHFLVEAFFGFFAAFESHVASCEEECVDGRFPHAEIGTYLVDRADECDVFLNECRFAFGI